MINTLLRLRMLLMLMLASLVKTRLNFDDGNSGASELHARVREILRRRVARGEHFRLGPSSRHASLRGRRFLRGCACISPESPI